MKNKKLKILLMTAWLEYFCGSELWTFTIAEELKRRGHKVEVYTYLKGIMTDAFGSIDVPIVDKIEDKYDLALINHNATLIKAPQAAYKIMTCHGVFPEQEQPIPGAGKYVSVSEEVYQNLFSKGFHSSVLHNPVNMEGHSGQRPINQKLKNVLLLSNKLVPTDNEFKIISESCRQLNLRLTPLGMSFGTAQWETAEWINNADLVISIGRGIYEAMGEGRNCIVAGYGNLAGFVDKKTYPEFLKTNCSGRGYGRPITVEGLVSELQKYNPEQGKINRKLVEQNHDVKKIVDRYLNFYFYRKYV